MLLILVTLAAYAMAYAQIHRADPSAFRFEDATVDPLYFALTTMSTVGFGDYAPKTRLAKGVVMSQQLVMVLEIVAAIELWRRQKRLV